MITYKELSTGLKVAVIYGYVSLVVNIILLGIGFIIGWSM